MSPPRLLLFDIDGTLLLTGGAGLRAMIRAGREVFGAAMSWDGVEMSGGLDPLLVGEAAARSALVTDPESLAAFRRSYVVLLPEEIERGGPDVRAMPGVLEVLAGLREREDVVLGLLTGNYPEGAALKLRAVGIDPGWFKVTAFGDEAASRPELVPVATEKLSALGVRPADPSRCIIIGDSPRDVECAIKNRCYAFAVATGKYGVDDLRTAGAHRVVKDLSNPAPLFDLLG
jgi:phosphoglycolate phosphatase